MKGKITYFHQCFLVDVGENERPFDKSVKSISNNMVDEWYEKCLVPYADSNGKITSQEATDRWYSPRLRY